MPDDVRVRRDWIDVRHEYLQIDGRWVAGMCDKMGFCRECNRAGERLPMALIAKAWEKGRAPADAARIVIAAHLFIPVKLADNDAIVRATQFTRLRIAQQLEIVRGEPITDADVLAARTIADLIHLALVPEEQETAG